MNIAKRIIDLLQKTGIKQKELCTKMGIYPTSLTDWKNKNTMPPADTALKIADFLGVSLRWLVFGEEDTSVPLTQEQKDLLEKWGWLQDDTKKLFMVMIDAAVEKEKKPATESIAG